jgi:hypothetical protein
LELAIRTGTPARQLRCLADINRSVIMAVIIDKDSGGSGGSAVLGFILGAVLLAVAVVGFLMWDNYKSGGAPKAVVVTGQAK